MGIHFCHKFKFGLLLGYYATATFFPDPHVAIAGVGKLHGKQGNAILNSLKSAPPQFEIQYMERASEKPRRCTVHASLKFREFMTCLDPEERTNIDYLLSYEMMG